MTEFLLITLRIWNGTCISDAASIWRIWSYLNSSSQENFSGLEGVSGFWHLVGSYWLVFGQRAEWMINSVSKEVKSAIAFCHLWPLFNKVVCGLLGNCPCVLRNKQTGWRDALKGRAALRTEAEGANGKPALVPPCLSSSQPGPWAQGSPSQKRAPDTHPQGERLEEQAHQDFTPLGTRELEQLSKRSWGAFLGRRRDR